LAAGTAGVAGSDRIVANGENVSVLEQAFFDAPTQSFELLEDG
jgi:hypothetical protein